MREPDARIASLSPTKRALLARRLAAPRSDEPVLRPRPRRVGVATFRTSFAQERLWFFEQLVPGTAVYNVTGAFRLSGRLDAGSFRRAVEAVVARHESLRTTFVAIDGRPMQVVSTGAPVSIKMADFRSDGAPAAREDEAHMALARDATQPFDVAHGPLVRVRVYVVTDELRLVSFAMHHLVADAWSVGVLLRELSFFYGAYLDRNDPDLAPPSLQYADYAEWQREQYAKERAATFVTYWRHQLSGAPYLRLSTREAASFRGAGVTRRMPALLVEALRAFAAHEGVTVFAITLSAWQALLGRRTGHDDVTVVTPVANRDRLAVSDVIGFFVNVVALRTDLGADPSFREAVRRTSAVVRDALRHQHLPFERVVSAVGGERNPTRAPISAIGFAMEHRPTVSIELPGVEATALSLETTTSKTEVVLIVRDHEANSMTATVEYDRALHDEAGAGDLLDAFLAGLERSLARPDARLSELVPDATSTRVAAELTGATVWRRFVAQARRTPHAIAVRMRDTTCTYAELSARAASVATELAGRGVGPGALVATWGRRDSDWLAAMLGTWCRGAVYLPLEPHWPAARLADVLRRSRTCLVLVGREARKEAIELPADVSWVDVPDASGEMAGDDGYETASDDAAYVIYTSGSTGAPKGCVIEHAGLLNHLEAKIGCLRLDGADGVAQTANAGFDISLWQCVAPLLVGARVEIFDDEVVRDPAALRRAIASSGVTILELVPAVLDALLAADEATTDGPDALCSLRYVLATGEALPPALCRRWLARHPEIPLVNAYGPTECADDVTHHMIASPPTLDATRIPIGRPIPATTVHVVDERLQPVPVGEAGELCIGGIGVGRGYLHEPELTARAFVTPDPFEGRPGTRLYRTGDRGRQRPDGDFEWLARLDAQTKIRGVRVAPEEIEAVLAMHPGVRAAAVAARPREGSTQLVAYVAVGPEPPRGDELRAYVAARLPEVMVPASYVLLTHLPYTSNGKIDREALGTAATPHLTPPSASVAPSGPPMTPSERVLAALWQEILGVAVPSVHESFFALGGDSLSAIRVVAGARRHGFVLTPQQIFAYPTIAALAELATIATASTVDQGPVIGAAPLTPIQRMLLAAELPDLDHYNMTVLLALDEAPCPSALVVAVEHLVRHHDALRLRLVREGTSARVVIGGLDGVVPYAHRDLSALPDADVALAIANAGVEAQVTLDLVAGPIARVVSFDLGRGRGGRVLLTVHHLACDAVSMPILLEDLAAVYDQMRRGDPIALPEKTSSYLDWARALEEYARAPERARDRAFWRRECADPGARFPRTRAGAPAIGDVARASSALDRADTAVLTGALGVRGLSIEGVVSTALLLAVTETTADEVMLVYLERHGRSVRLPEVDVSRTVGWFTAVFPVALRIAPGREPLATLEAVDRHLREIPDGGVAWGAVAYSADDDPSAADLGALPMPEVSVNFIGRVEPPATSRWRLAPESVGCEHGRRGSRPTVLDVVARVEDGRLVVDWHYDAVLLGERLMTDGIARFGRILRELVRLLSEASNERSDGGTVP